MRLDGYVRVSRVNGRQGKSFISPDVQRDAIVAWAQAHGHEIIAWHEELDRSGGAGKRRPVFEAMLARVEAGDTGGVVVWKFSRFGRSLIEAAVRIQKIEKEAGGVVESATEGAQSKATRNIMLVMAEEELDRLTETWSEAQRRAVERGVWINGPAPLGYRKTEESTLEVAEPGAQIVREAFRLAASEGMHAAMRYLADAVPGRRWRTDETRTLLSNRAYLGEIVYGELHNALAHEPLVTLATWEAAQSEPRSRRSNGDYPLSHIGECECGGALVGGLQGVHGRKYRRYRCTACSRCSISAEKLEGWARETLALMLADEVFRDRFSPDGLKEAQEALRDAEEERARFGSDLEARQLLGHDAWIAGLQARARAVEAARARFGEISQRSAQAQVLPAAGQFSEPAQFARALAVIRAIVVRRGRGTVSERVLAVHWAVLDGHDVAGAEVAA